MAELESGAHIRNTIRNLSGNSGSGLVSVPVETVDARMAARVLQIQVFELTDHIVQLTDQVAALTQHVQYLESRRH